MRVDNPNSPRRQRTIAISLTPIWRASAESEERECFVLI